MRLPSRSVGFAFSLALALAPAGGAQAASGTAATAATGADTAQPAPGSDPAPPQVAVQLEPSSPTVGDPVVATITLALAAADADREATFPDWTQGWGEAEVLNASAVEETPAADGVRWVQRLRLTAFRPGKTALPPVELRLSGEPTLRVTTPPGLALDVRSVIAVDDKELKPAPPSPPRALAVPASFWWALAVGGALTALAAVAAWKRRPGVDPLAAPELSPMAELERALERLAAEAPAGAFAHLSQALRRYLGRRLGFHALESTTTEVQRRLAALRFDPALVQRAARLLRLADQIKFARRPAESAEATARIAETRELAGTIESHLAPIEEAAAAAASAASAGSASGRSQPSPPAPRHGGAA